MRCTDIMKVDCFVVMHSTTSSRDIYWISIHESDRTQAEPVTLTYGQGVYFATKARCDVQLSMLARYDRSDSWKFQHYVNESGFVLFVVVEYGHFLKPECLESFFSFLGYDRVLVFAIVCPLFSFVENETDVFG